MLEPAFRIVPSLIANLPHKLREFQILSDDNSALASRDLFIGIERKYANIPESSYLPALVFGTDRFARILNDTESMTPCDRENSFQVCRAAEGMYNDDGFRSGGDRGLNSVRI